MVPISVLILSQDTLKRMSQKLILKTIQAPTPLAPQMQLKVDPIYHTCWSSAF